MNRTADRLRRVQLLCWLLVAPLIMAGLLYWGTAYGADLAQRSLMLSDATPSAIATYRLAFTIPAPETLGSIQLEFCANDPLIGDPCTVPTGFDVSSATLSAQSGEVGFSVDPSTTANNLVLSRIPSAAGAGSVTYTLTGVINPDTAATYYGRLQTFATNNASGPENDHGGIAFSVNDTVQITTEVPPYLLFCGGVTIGGFDCLNASGDYLNFGNLTTGATANATSQLLTASNAGNGFTISVYGLTMTSGNNVIGAISPQDVSRPGVAQFGFNLVANSTPSVGTNPQGTGAAAPVAGYNLADWFKFVSGDAIAAAPTSDEYRKLTISYIINIPAGQASGVYSTTLTYICLANF